MGIKMSGMDKVEAWSAGASMLTPGSHNVYVATADEGTSSGGHPQIELEFFTDDGTGSIRDWLVLSPAAYGKAKALLNAVGITSDSEEFELEASDLIGRKLEIIVGEEPDYNDPAKMRRRVQAYKALSDVPGDTSGLGSDGDKQSDLPF